MASPLTQWDDNFGDLPDKQGFHSDTLCQVMNAKSNYKHMKKDFILLLDLEIYQLARQLSQIAWTIYGRLTYQEKKIWGDQMLGAIDSVGANIAEGYGRYHYLEKMRFYFIARASLSEGKDHWLDLGLERNFVTKEEWEQICKIHKPLQIKLNNTISKTYQSRKGGSDERE